ncbi:hypothetical protein [Anaerobiospirillum succiniciproducens]|uniref:hypothetical protein n=1 Tax=Anaerobiospirillum succiniciproducens TaxID=13335 RepID=UPI000403C8A2|nr:hypothetical protein [Anaerobiospirillum succiniciproducens]
MAKTIKFNLMCDGYPCRNIEDVQEHFCIEDMLEYYESGLLKRWLEVRGFKDELAEVEAIKATEVLQITEELIRIFEILTDEDKVKEAVSLINYQKKRQAANQVNEERGYQSATVISNYVSGYDSIVKEMLDKSTPSKVVQQHINTLATDYQPLFEKNIYPLFITSLQDRPLVCLNLLYNEHSRKFLVPKYSSIDQYRTTNAYDVGILDNRIKDFKENEKLIFSSIQPNNFPFMLFNSIGLETRYESFKSLQSLFEGQLKVVMNIPEEKKVFEKRGTRCLFVTAYDFTLVKIYDDSNGTEDYNSSNISAFAALFGSSLQSAGTVSPFQITDGLTLSSIDYSDYPVAYFKVDD